MSNSQINWLKRKYGQKITSKYKRDSLVIPPWNSVQYIGALQDLKLMICLAFVPEYLDSLTTTGAREKP